MQIKKEELRNDIIRIAENEFFYHGYQNASLRMIAKKANTTLGNLYHYFPSKEAILDAVLEDYPEEVIKVFTDHEDYHETYKVLTYEQMPEINALLEAGLVEVFHMDVFICRRFVILMQGCDNTKYEAIKNKLVQLAASHLASHYKTEECNKYLQIIVNSMIQTFIDIAKKNLSPEEASNLVKEYMITVLLGMMCRIIESESNE